MNKEGQEEIIGFAVIIVLVSIILLIFLGVYLRTDSSTEEIQNYEIDSFIQGFLQYTSDCESEYEGNFVSMQDLILMCEELKVCVGGESSCNKLKNLGEGIIQGVWFVGETNEYRGVDFRVESEKKVFLEMSLGDKSNSYESSTNFVKGNEVIRVNLKRFR